jgi:hydroxymethylpyrimidine/phosphomethylpyrimidine kinase
MIPNALSVAGSDPSGGAGIQADLKAFAANRVYGMAAITALTVQTTRGVRGVHLVPPAFVAEQITALREDAPIHAVKIGMIGAAEIAEAVAGALAGLGAPIVLDPVMVAKGGDRLLAREAVAALIARLLPMATLLTPNLPEAEALLTAAGGFGRGSAFGGGAGAPIRSRTAMAEAALALLEMGPRAVLLKGGHLEGPDSPDVLVWNGGLVWLEGARSPTRNTHGTGCSLSSALAARLARGEDLPTACLRAKAWLSGAIATADRLDVGEGHGPLNHFHALWGA